MKKATRLGTMLAGSLLLATFETAGAQSREPLYQAPPALTPVEQVCWNYGLFAYNRAAERDGGWAMLDMLSRIRQWDAQHNASADILRWHEALIHSIYELPERTPLELRQFTERYCLQERQAQPSFAPALRDPSRY